jgi:uncharacterized protein (DUF2062 family)
VAVFRRRVKRKTHHELMQWVWPSMGWPRMAKYFSHRVRRMPDTPSSIAAGFSCGVAISFTPFIGLHFVLAASLAWLLNGNLFASAVGTMIGNPWTFPLIWMSSYELGIWLLGVPDTDLPEHVTLRYIFDHPSHVFLPMAIGGVVEGAAAWFVSFLSMRPAITAYQRIRQIRRRHRREELRRRAAAVSAAAPLTDRWEVEP